MVTDADPIARLRAAAERVVAADRPLGPPDALDGWRDRQFEDEPAMWAYHDAAVECAGALAAAVLALMDEREGYPMGGEWDHRARTEPRLVDAAAMLPEGEGR